jgi:hypothetical protein
MAALLNKLACVCCLLMPCGESLVRAVYGPALVPDISSAPHPTGLDLITVHTCQVSDRILAHPAWLLLLPACLCCHCSWLLLVLRLLAGTGIMGGEAHSV